MGKILTSKEIAKQAGVSVSTVSIVLNQKPGVSEETRSKILNIFDENGIRLKNTSKNIDYENRTILYCKIAKHGNVINERHNVFISEYSDAIIEESNRLGYTVEITNYNKVPIDKIIADIDNSRKIIGCIILATEFTLNDILAFQSLSVPCVFIDAIFQMIPGHFVSMDNDGMIFSIISYLKNHGHQKIGMLKNDGASNFIARNQAFQLSLTQLGLNYNDSYVFNVRSTYKEAYEDVCNILQTSKRDDFPSVFFACSDIVAIGAIRAFKEYGIKIPEQVSIVGFDNLPLSSIVEPGLTSMEVPKTAIGHFSVRMLLDIALEKKPKLPDRCVFSGYIVERNSVSLI